MEEVNIMSNVKASSRVKSRPHQADRFYKALTIAQASDDVYSRDDGAHQKGIHERIRETDGTGVYRAWKQNDLFSVSTLCTPALPQAEPAGICFHALYTLFPDAVLGSIEETEQELFPRPVHFRMQGWHEEMPGTVA